MFPPCLSLPSPLSVTSKPTKKYLPVLCWPRVSFLRDLSFLCLPRELFVKFLSVLLSPSALPALSPLSPLASPTLAPPPCLDVPWALCLLAQPWSVVKLSQPRTSVPITPPWPIDQVAPAWLLALSATIVPTTSLGFLITRAPLGQLSLYLRHGLVGLQLCFVPSPLWVRRAPPSP